MPHLDPRLTAVPQPDGMAVVQDLGGGWTAIFRMGLDHPRIDSVTIVPMARSPIAGAGTPVPTQELSSRMLRELVPGAAIAHAAASWNALFGPGSVPLAANRKWLAGHLGGERLALVLGRDWLAAIERVEGRKLEISLRDARRWQMLSTAARYVAAVQAGDRTPVAKVAKELGLPQSKVRDRLYAARRAGLLEGTGKGRAGGDLTPEGRALFLEVAEQ